MATTPKLSIIIPCYNEEGNIPLIINELKKITDVRDDIEILLVNNGSTDNSKKIFDVELKKIKSQCFRVVDVKKNNGYGHGILTGLSKANGNLLSWTHADMQTDPLDIVKALDLYQSSKEDRIIVKGKRKNRKLSEAFFTFGMQVVTFFLLRIYLDDINAQPKLFSKDFYNRHIKNGAPNDFSLDLYFLYKAKINKYKILEIPVFFKKRIYGKAKGGGGSWQSRINLIRRTFKYIKDFRKN